MHMLRTLSRALAIAVSSAWMLAPAVSSAGTLTCTPTSLSVAPDSQGNLAVSCTDAGGTTTPPPTTVCAITPATSSLTSLAGSTTVSVGLTANSACGTVSNWSVTGTGGTFSATSGSTTTLTLQAVASGGTAASYTVTATGSTSATASVTVNPVPRRRLLVPRSAARATRRRLSTFLGARSAAAMSA